MTLYLLCFVAQNPCFLLPEHFAEPFEVSVAVAAGVEVEVEVEPAVEVVFLAFGIVAEADVAAVAAAAEVVVFAAAEQVWSASVAAGTVLTYHRDGFDLEVFAMADLKVFCPFWTEQQGYLLCYLAHLQAAYPLWMDGHYLAC